MDARVLDRINKSKRKLAKVATALKLRFVGLTPLAEWVGDTTGKLILKWWEKHG